MSIAITSRIEGCGIKTSAARDGRWRFGAQVRPVGVVCPFRFGKYKQR